VLYNSTYLLTYVLSHLYSIIVEQAKVSAEITNSGKLTAVPRITTHTMQSNMYYCIVVFLNHDNNEIALDRLRVV